jgi:hypothetical protein
MRHLIPVQAIPLGFLTGKLQQKPRPVVIAVELRPGMVEHERKDEFLDQTEQTEIVVSADLFARRQERQGFHPR